MESSTPSPERRTWGPPREQMISRTLPDAQPLAPRRRLTAHDVRRAGGLAALASSAAVIGYMATTAAVQPSAQTVIVATATNPQPVAAATTPTTPITPATTAATTPAAPVTTAVPAPAVVILTPVARTQQSPPQNQSNTASHGS